MAGLDQVMGMLRKQGTVDPKAAQQVGQKNSTISADIYATKPTVKPAVKPTIPAVPGRNQATMEADIYAPTDTSRQWYQDQMQQLQPQQPWLPNQGQWGNLDSLMKGLGGPGISPAPELEIDADYVNQLIQQWGIAPRSQDEIAAHAKAIVERQALGRSQIIQREIDRFERDFPHEFEKASGQIKEEAAKMNAASQEEFASRGMFYSSVMASAVGQVDEKAMEMIGEISRDAANRVADLHADLRDVAEWAVLEEEVVRRTLEQEDQALRQQLMNVTLEVALRAEQTALDRWYQQEQLKLQAYSQRLQAVQMRAQQAEAQGQYLALAFMANDSVIQESLKKMGMTEDRWNQMPLDAQAALVSQVINYEGIQLERTGINLQNQLLAGELAAQEAYGKKPISAEQAFSYVMETLGSVQDIVNVKKLGKYEAQNAAYRLQQIKNTINYIPDPQTKAHFTQQVQRFEGILESKYPGIMGSPSSAPTKETASSTSSGPTTGWGRVGSGLKTTNTQLTQALNWLNPTGTLGESAFVGLIDGLKKPSSSSAESWGNVRGDFWAHAKKKLGLK